MRYLWCSDRIPKQATKCRWCGQPFALGYLRDVDTHEAYCSPHCFAMHVSTSEAFINAYNKHKELTHAP
jgi:hypothetical protein